MPNNYNLKKNKKYFSNFLNNTDVNRINNMVQIPIANSNHNRVTLKRGANLETCKHVVKITLIKEDLVQVSQ